MELRCTVKIAFSGTQCVGKTTIVNLLKLNIDAFSKLQHHYFTPSITHELVDMNLPINKGAGDISQILILSNAIRNACNENVISDRCILDVYVYTKYNTGKSVSNDLYNVTYDIYKRLVNSYDVIFYLPPEIDIIDNGIRSVDAEFREELHALFIQECNKLTNIVHLPGNIDEKFDRIKEVLI